MTAFSVSSLLDKAAGALYRAADEDHKSAAQKERLAQIASDPKLQSQINGVIAQAVLVGATTLERVRDAFGDDQPTPAPKPEPSPEPEAKAEAPKDETSTASPFNGPGGLFVSGLGDTLPPEIQEFIDRLNRQFRDGTQGSI